MTITAKFPSVCAICGGKIRPGDKIEWEKGKRAAHTYCAEGREAPKSSQSSKPVAAPEHIIAGAPGGIQHTSGRNRRGDFCRDCGCWVEPGQGHLLFCVEDSGCLEHHDHSGYHVTCLDPAVCATRKAERLAQKAAERATLERRRAITPQAWCKDGSRWAAATDLLHDEDAVKAWRAISGWTLEVSSRSDSSGVVDEGSLRIVGDDILYYHGGFYDDYRATLARLVGAAPAYLAALRTEISEERWVGTETIRELGHFLAIRRPTVVQ